MNTFATKKGGQSKKNEIASGGSYKHSEIIFSRHSYIEKKI